MRYIILLLLAFTTMEAFQVMEPITITGTITDSKGNPLEGVFVMIKGTKTGTTSGPDGTFTITLPDEKSALTFSSVGYETKTIVPGSRRKLNIVLKDTEQALDEVVVTNQRPMEYKKDANVDQRLSGSLPGVQVNTKRGKGTNLSKPLYGNNQQDYNREGYDRITENNFRKVADEPLSTFSIDVDGASYSNVRRFLNNNQLPPDGAVRVEEMINYFQYGYAQPKNGDPFAIYTEMSACPWNEDHRLVMIGLQGKKVAMESQPASNLTFLIDVSGSMQSPDKLPLVKASLKLLAEQLREEDMVSIVVYAGTAGLVLSPTSGANPARIIAAIDELEAGVSTAGGQGIKLAYATAKRNFVR